MKYYRKMHSAHGFLDWWPGDSALEVCVGAILTQNTNWQNVEKALANLKNADKLSLGALYEIEKTSLSELIRPAGYFRVKANRLKNFINFVWNFSPGNLTAFLNQPIEILRANLLEVNGIGPETADSIVLYAANLPSFVVDAYTMRIFTRHKLIQKSDKYDAVKAFFEANLPADVELFKDYHGQIVETAKRYCKKKPQCDLCPLKGFEHDCK